MAKVKTKKKPIAADKVPHAAVFLKAIATRKERLAKVKTAATKDGKFSKYDPKYREALKALKRDQRSLLKQRIRFTPKGQAAAAAAAAVAAPAAPAAAAPAAEEKK